MSTADTLKKSLQRKDEIKKPLTIARLLEDPAIKKRFQETLDKKAPQFISSIINLVKSTKGLAKADPMTVLASALIAATLDLPVDPNLGFAWIVPYGNQAQFMLGYKGYIQLALRTGQYRNINAIPIYEGQLKAWNPLTEEIEIDFEGQLSDAVIGYAGMFELINGFRKTVYWSKDEILKHKKKFSKTDYVWKENFDAMALKTVLRNLLSKWGILSIEMQQAVSADENVAPPLIDSGDDNIWPIAVDEPENVTEAETEDMSEEKPTVAENATIPNRFKEK